MGFPLLEQLRLLQLVASRNFDHTSCQLRGQGPGRLLQTSLGHRLKSPRGGNVFIIALVRPGAAVPGFCGCWEAIQPLTHSSPRQGHPAGSDRANSPPPRLGLAGRRGWAVNSPIVQCRLGPGRQPAPRAGTACVRGKRGALCSMEERLGGWTRARDDSAWEGQQPGPGNLKMSREWVLVCLSRGGEPRDEEPRMERGVGAQSE